MRRAILAITATVAGLVALLSFKSHLPSTAAAAATSGTGSVSAGASTGASTGPGALPSSSPAAKPAAGETSVTGDVAETVYGPVQLQLIEKGGKIVKVTVLQQPHETANDIQIGEFAFPKLISETLVAQSAKIDSVSGATYTSGGYVSSLQSALDRA